MDVRTADAAVIALPTLEESRTPSITDQVYQALYDRVINLGLPPGTKLSEVEVATQMGASRQPVRDAFYRLSQLGFVQIRPQRATTVTYISETAVLRAQFIRTALEIACIRQAAVRLTDAQLDALDAMIAQQEQAAAAGEREQFQALDDGFHRQICDFTGLDFAWALIKDNKGHMDRARFLSLSFGAPTAIEDHRQIIAALRDQNADAAAAAMQLHLGRIRDILARMRLENPSIFGEA